MDARARAPSDEKANRSDDAERAGSPGRSSRPDRARDGKDDTASRSRALVVRANEYGFDSFGFHRDHLVSAARIMRWLYRSYFRAEAQGVENIPASGRVLFVANHSGQLPFDGMVIGAAAFFEPPQPRLVRSMVEHFVPTVPFVSYLLSRWGQITGTPENCRRLLHQDEAILVFPEGARGIAKSFSRRYQLEQFGLGFMRLALETNTPIVPVAVIGAEEQAPAVNLRPLARLLGVPAFPIVPYPPFVPLLPLPVKYRLYFAEPMTFTGDPDDDDDVLGEKVKAVKNRIQSMIHLGLRERKHVFW
jgi:1-acyl-sn-glycerol-3-phosphate acyltransferase